MLKLFRFLKPYWWQTLILLIATTAQVYTTLRLPALMANIINNGIIDLTNQFYKYGYVDEYKLKYYFSKINEIIDFNI